MTPIKTIRGLLLTAAVVFSTLLAVATQYVVSGLYERSIREEAMRHANTFAEVTFQSMFQLMRTGWTRTQLEEFIRAIERSVDKTPHQIAIYRAPRVAELFGEIKQREMDAAILEVIASGESLRLDRGPEVRFINALRAEAECRQCHTNAKPGEVLGVIDVRQDVRPLLEAGNRQFLFAFAPVVPIAIAATLLMVVYIRRRLNKAIAGFATNIRSINRLSDLKQLENASLDFGFSEFSPVATEVRQLTERVRSVAVDKEMLEFEIRLLEKFILTSDVVKDWREYVNRLLIDIDGVMPAYALFSIFKTGDDVFDLEVFWRCTPSSESRQLFEETVRESLRRNPYFAEGYAVTIEHNIADSTRNAPELVRCDIEVQTKSLLVEAPKIGGIVGIGMQAQAGTDATRWLVVESILSTLLNVVGSVKAIDKYTKDLEYYATRDPLTNLYNQRVFWELLDSEATRSGRHGYKFGLLMIDADNFKSVNDTYGHGFGDVFLQEVAVAIRRAIREDDLLARYGGDEFVAILPETDLAGTLEVAQRIIDTVTSLSIETPDGARVSGSLSVGMAVYPDHAIETKDLFLFADSMMYRAKADGKGRVAVPTEQDVVEVFRSLSEKSMLILAAVEARGVIPYYQPIIDPKTGKVEALEVLARIRLDDGSILVADAFVAIAEKMGLMHKLDYILMERALEAATAANYQGLLFLNMSPRALVLNDFVQETRRIASASGFDPSRIVFEITERETIKNMALLERFINTLRSEGFRLAIDDFGSGFSSFHYVKRFPIDFLKIEGDFIVGMKQNDKDRALVRSIVALARELGIRTVAEYVEDAEVLDKVIDQSIDLAQGYHIQRPTPSIEQAISIST
ncbi:bifunctional diguanylate cyclase/phosphodiesterase [Aromatoleum toluclasticum]|uniref:putative bifunctional diguanylate cyclase/phosphodiesterase n=1 Tax=Aromatoleum toluclasticum TaxID=92003 RepID=UPI001D19887E|nr:bifunctional diguanylate cyclase/phosphodiesterase [Aromatoleum toluclasticum]MCC4116449.1 bifunctional diguanylate cyclase/phosphodiesterase [Aromatoleum toluclasticum]